MNHVNHVKMSGMELKAFFGDESVWSANGYQDDLLVQVGEDEYNEDRPLMVSAVPDSAEVIIKGGQIHTCDRAEPFDMVRSAKEWLARQKKTNLVIICEESRVDELRILLRDNGFSFSEG